MGGIWSQPKAVTGNINMYLFKKPGRVTIAGHSSDELAPGTLNSVFKQAQLKKSKNSERWKIMYRFLIVIEKANGNYSAYCPDLPGCVATGKTREETERNMHEAVEMHVQGLLEDKLSIPDSVSFAEYIEVTA